LPLFDEDVVKKLSGEKVDASKTESVPMEEETGNNDMPTGFSILTRSLMSVHRGVGASLLEPTNCGTLSMGNESFELDRHLGSGAFSHVFRLKKIGNVFVKVPKSSRMKNALETEANALKDLTGNIHIPNLFDAAAPLKSLSIRIRCEKSDLHCLPLKGLIDVSANKLKAWTNARLQSLILQVYAALLHANQKGGTHLDVRPSNIIVHPSGDGCIHVMLIDWGCAHRTTETLKGFVGCPPYAHDDLLGLQKVWSPCLHHDVASLAYTVARLKVESIPWVGGFSDHKSMSDDIRKHRFDEVNKILKPLFHGLHIPVPIKDALLNAIGSKGSESTNGNAPDNLHEPDNNGAMDSTSPGIQNKKRKLG
jgi:serine/threonine protein kinase